MAAGGEEKGADFYAVLGLKKECSAAELKNAYKKLALIWHPDRCSASGNSKFVEEAKIKFQAIQEAYSVLSDTNKRFLYDVGVYDTDDDENEMGEFLGEMAAMMKQTELSEGGNETLEELQELFVEMFQADMDGAFGGPTAASHQMHLGTNGYDRPSSSNSMFSFCMDGDGGAGGGSHKRNNSGMNSGMARVVYDGNNDPFGSVRGFCFGVNESENSSKGRGSSKRRNGRKQKVSSRHDVSSRDAEISAA